jgi:uncharacterized protein
MIETLLIPGLNGSGTGHWQREWEARDPAADLLDQEDWARPRLSDWLHALEARLESLPGIVLVAHSLGCALVAALARRPAAAHVAGALLVAPAQARRLSQAVPGAADFADASEGRLPFPSILVASRDDSYMRFDEAEEHAGRWGSGLVDLGRAGHINVASGFGHWPEGMVLADGLRGRPAPALAAGAARPTAGAWRPRPAASFVHDGGLGVGGAV